MKIRFYYFLLLLSSLEVYAGMKNPERLVAARATAYHDFKVNSCIVKEMHTMIRPHLLPETHAIKPVLDAIFSEYGVNKNADSLARAGFVTVSVRPFTFLTVVRHPCLPGYIQKIYLESDQRVKPGKPGWKWLVQRCQGADNIRKLIKAKKLKHFTVPDKWLYPLKAKPKHLQAKSGCGQPVILITTDMNLVSQAESEEAWKTKVTYEVLDELYEIISHGLASSHLSWNIPYTNDGTFSCIDTEHPVRKPDYKSVKLYLSKKMGKYWDALVKAGGRSKYKKMKM